MCTTLWRHGRHSQLPYLTNVATGKGRTVSSHNFNSQNSELGSSSPRAVIAYFHFRMPFESSNLPGVGPIFPDWAFENWPCTSAAPWAPSASLSPPSWPRACPANARGSSSRKLNLEKWAQPLEDLNFRRAFWSNNKQCLWDLSSPIQNLASWHYDNWLHPLI